MHRLYAAWFLILLASGVASGQKAPPSNGSGPSADREELARLEKVWNEAHLQGNADALEHLWADDLEVAVPLMPVMSKAEALSFARSGRMKFSRYETSDLHIRTYGSAAVVSGRLQRRRTIGGREVEDDWRFTKVYIRGEGGWRVVSFHAAEAAKPSS